MIFYYHYFNIQSLTQQKYKLNKMQSEPNVLDNEFDEVEAPKTPHKDQQTLSPEEYISNVHQKLQEQIQQGKLEIPDQQKTLQSKKSSPKLEEDLKKSRLEMIRKINKEKHKILNNLQNLQERQFSIKKQIRGGSCSPENKKSEYTEAQKQKIRHILHIMKIKQLENDRKHNQILNSFTDQMLQQRQKQKQQILKAKQYHREVANKNLLSLQLRKQRREQFREQIKQYTKQQKHKKYIYQQKQKINELMRHEEEQRSEFILHKIKESHKFDFKEVLQHSARYRELKQMNQSVSKAKRKLLTEVEPPKKYDKNKFAEILEEEEKQKKTKEEEKIKKAFELRKRIQSFGEVVKEKYRPHLSSKPPTSSLASPTKYSQAQVRQALSHNERSEKGNQYLQIAKRKRKDKDSLTQKLLTEPSLGKPQQNYLNQVRVQKRRKTSTSHKINELLKQTENSEPDYDTAKKAADLVDEISYKSKKKGKDQRLIEEIEYKLSILKVFL